jgi:hypothetical protein
MVKHISGVDCITTLAQVAALRRHGFFTFLPAKTSLAVDLPDKSWRKAVGTNQV